ncbi:DNA-directed RNA polymerase III subunit C11, putative [Trypanosoma equiperdum]|uniref:DNA-directed RNA polymerase subunit n=4 Tax=Trypanozoon TaxID=39700 RepID=Q387Z6_TRYB2|nr:DNA-directed RNA polymerase III, putative [Trypanosoma brucei gambiense DAL972]XP_827988.1 RNA polymerase III C11 subunit, putative [Trypanosoma brucei brucei TREU927]RHW69106.1 DNA-directed RNA polymerase III subunit C11 [Trypanosoma brucei equiperdum]SCU66573.1 DNA-directed RNA polymerase III subunit C11, putative [Trypanosoma equiperdum]EAN78876.1 RNA polymerase III C11 subunit, putative [Trypanosoma brucei brucei TREU927]CBH16741.1 DNA-directed RNA polymerase III, putative [Trypanosoma |eukprot:XP_011779005.1 DNA-directed RNA polymerase III, putative [Trypanosoma brucei gambiense DAL972]
MFFCPFCGTLLLIEPAYPCNRFSCSSCRYVVPIQSRRPLTINHSFLKYNKVVDDDDEKGSSNTVKRGVKEEEEVDGGQVITVRCQNDEKQCDGDRAHYVQIQMRSADEPATTFFKCLKCGFQWKQD